MIKPMSLQPVIIFCTLFATISQLSHSESNGTPHRANTTSVGLRNSRRFLWSTDDQVPLTPSKFQHSITQQQQKQKQKLPRASLTVPLHASAGTHHVHVYVGSPPQRQTLIVDTGSRLMAFPCEPCHNCGRHVSPYFHPGLSTTDRSPSCGSCLLKGVSKCSDFLDRCIISQKYTEGSSWTAYETEDLVWLGSSDLEESLDSYMKLAVPYAFGCQTAERGLFQKQYADGILGLAIHETSIIRSLYDAKSTSREAFSLCLTRTGGSFSVGGIASPIRHLEEMKYSPLARDHGWFALQVWEVRLGGICVACDPKSDALSSFHGGKGTILDSGTTDTYLPKAILERFQEVWMELTGISFLKRKRRYTWLEYLKLPSIAIMFQGNVTMTIDPSSYMEGVPSTVDWSGSRELVNRVYVDEPEGAVLGANAMTGHEILFDIHGQQVGMARANCDHNFDGTTMAMD
jgi:Xylanase inhibitor N-terminal